MGLIRVLFLVFLGCLAGCVTNSPDVLLSTTTDQPVGQVKTAGQFPIIGHVPVGQTQQLTPTEKAAVTTELNRDAQSGRAQASQNTEADYNNEVDALKKLAREREKALREKIEGENNS